MTWEEFEKWLQEPEQKALWQLRDKDKRNAYNYCGPNRPANPYNLTYYREIYEEVQARDDSSDTLGLPETHHCATWMRDAEKGMHDFLAATRGVNYKEGDTVSVLDYFNWKVVGISREMAFMHDAVYMEGQASEEIPLPYAGCDYDYSEDINYMPPSDVRADQYLNESEPC